MVLKTLISTLLRQVLDEAHGNKKPAKENKHTGLNKRTMLAFSFIRDTRVCKYFRKLLENMAPASQVHPRYTNTHYYNLGPFPY